MYNTNLVVGSGMAGLFRCNECHMNFQSQPLLTKHKSKFCVGKLGDPDDLQLRRGFRTVSPPRHYSPDDRASSSKLRASVESTKDKQDGGNSPRLISSVSDNSDGMYTALSDGDMILPQTPKEQVLNAKPYTDSMLVNKKISQLKQLKEQRTRKRDLNDFEERLLLDQIEGAERGSPRSTQRNKATAPLSKHRDIRDLQLEYERLRDLETSVAKQPVRMISSRTGRLSPYSRGTDSSMSIHIVDDDYRRPNQDQLRSLAENHGRQMEYLQLRNKDLEKQREDILKRLEGLGRRSVVPQQDNTAELLRELREQEIRNQRALDDLKRQLYNMNTNQKVNVMDVEIISRNIGRSITQIKRLEESMKLLEGQVHEAVKKYNIIDPFNKTASLIKNAVKFQARQKENKDKPASVDEIRGEQGVSDKQKDTEKDLNESDVIKSGDHERQCQESIKENETIHNVDNSKEDYNDLKMDKETFSDRDKHNDMQNNDKGIENSTFEKIMAVIKQRKVLQEKLAQLQSERRDMTLPSHSEVEKPVYPMPMQAPPPAPAPLPPPPPEQKKQLVFPVYYGKSLVAEISAIRQAYLQNGGNDPDVLAQMAQMLAEAQAIEDQMNQKPDKKSPREKPTNNNEMIKFMEMENERLNQELRFLHEQKLLAQNRGKSDKEDELEREIRRLQRDHLEKMYGLQKEMDDLRMLLMMERNKPAPQHTIIQQPAQAPPPTVFRESTPWLLQKPYVEVEPIAAYDQYPVHYPKSAASHHTWSHTQSYRPLTRPQPCPQPRPQPRPQPPTPRRHVDLHPEPTTTPDILHKEIDGAYFEYY